MSDRLEQMKHWLGELGYRDFDLSPASEDASFRSYLRLETGDETFIVMDAPPDKESCDSFIQVAKKLRGVGLNAPEIIARDLQRGFLLLTDFGNRNYLSQLDETSMKPLYADALNALHTMQARIDCDDLPPYDETLLDQEMDLFHDWFLGKLLDLQLDSGQQQGWLRIKRLLVDNALAQPRVFVHRDYHSRNLMRLDSGNPGILDFQDAVRGPVTYDLVSLLRDCYIAWPLAEVEAMVSAFYRQARDDLPLEVSAGHFLQWFDLMGIQRHLKAIGIFSRLKIRDSKQGFLKDIPRTLHYVTEVSQRNESMAELGQLIESLAVVDRIETLVAA